MQFLITPLFLIVIACHILYTNCYFFRVFRSKLKIALLNFILNMITQEKRASFLCTFYFLQTFVCKKAIFVCKK